MLTHRLPQILQTVLGVGRVNDSVDTNCVIIYRAAEDRTEDTGWKFDGKKPGR
jgi:hypothetical protein